MPVLEDVDELVGVRGYRTHLLMRRGELVGAQDVVCVGRALLGTALSNTIAAASSRVNSVPSM